MPIKEVDIDEAQSRFAELICEVAAGTEVVLTRDSKPCVRLLPVESKAGERIPGLHLESMTAADDFDAPLSDQFWAAKP